MWPQHFSTGTTITIFECTNAQCTGSSRKVPQAIGSCISVDAKYRMKIIAATSENTPVSTPVSTPTTAVVPSPVRSPISGALTGYGFFAMYLDDSCTTFASATILPLNICFTDTDGTYTKLSFTSTTFRSEKYSDDACSMLSVAGTP
jgi:hypothetical protein